MNRLKIGGLCKQKRNELNLSLEQAGEKFGISPASISNIERGVNNVHKNLLKEYIIQIGLEEEIFAIIPASKKKELEILSELDYIDGLVDAGKTKYALQRLKKMDAKILNTKDKTAAHALSEFIKGRCFFEERSFNKSKKHFRQAISLVEQTPEIEDSNIIAASLNEMSRIAYFENDLKGALEFTNDGLWSYISNGERTYTKYYLLVNKSLYLERLNCVEESLECIEELEKELKSIDADKAFEISSEIIIHMHIKFASILSKLKLRNKALTYAKQGLKIAKSQKRFNDVFTLHTDMGNILLKVGNPQKAAEHFADALEFRNYIRKKHLLIPAYIGLGKIKLQKKKWIESEKYLQKAVALGEENNLIIECVAALISLADCHLKQKNYKKAIKVLNKALLMTKQNNQNNLKNHEKNIVMRLCKCYKSIKDNIKYQEYVNSLFAIIETLEGSDFNA